MLGRSVVRVREREKECQTSCLVLKNAGGICVIGGLLLNSTSYVVAGTDMGVERPKGGGTINYSFLDDSAKAINFNHRGAHLATVVAQQVTKAY